MLKDDPTSLFQEIQAAEKLRDEIVTESKSMIRMYHGPKWRRTQEPEDGAPENHFFEWLSLIKPQVIHHNPQVLARSRRSGGYQRSAKVLGSALTSWARSENLAALGRRLFDDTAFSYGVAMTYYRRRGRPGDAGLSVFSPAVRRVAPERWFCDPSCDYYDPRQGEGRYAGHMWRRDKTDLLEDDRYNREAVTRIAEDADLAKWDREDARRDNKRGQIIGYEVWVPEHRLPEYADHPLVNGTLFTLAAARNANGDQTEARWIRDPRPSFGPPDGPYTLFGYHFVPSCPYPLSPFAAIYDQIIELNQHAVATARSAASYKRLVGVDPIYEGDAATIENAEHGQVAIIKGLKEGAVKEIGIGGADETMYKYLEMLRERRDRSTGLSDNARGNVDSSASATAIQDAANQRDARLGLTKALFNDGMAQILRSAGWYFFEMSDAMYELDDEQAGMVAPRPKYLPSPEEADRFAAEDGLPVEFVRDALRHEPKVIYAGGPADQLITTVPSTDGEPLMIVAANIGDLAYDDLEIDIDPMSMPMVDQSLLQVRMNEVTTLYLQAVPLIHQFAHLPWDDLFDRIGQTLNMPDLGELLPMAEIRQLAQAHTQQQQAMQPQAAAPRGSVHVETAGQQNGRALAAGMGP